MIRSIFQNLNSLAESVLVDDEQVISLAVARLLRVDDISPHLYILFLQIFQNTVHHHHHQILGGLTLQARSFLSPKPPMLNLLVPGTSLTEESKEPLLKILPLIREAPCTRGLKTCFHKKRKARCLKARIWDDVSRVVSGKVTEIRVSLARSHLLRQFLLLLFFMGCTVQVATRIGSQHTELVKDEKAETLIMEGETRPGKRTASFDVF